MVMSHRLARQVCFSSMTKGGLLCADTLRRSWGLRRVLLVSTVRSSIRRVVLAGRVAIERTSTVGRVSDVGVVKERMVTVGGVGVAGFIGNERVKSNSRVVAASGVAIERGISISRVVATGGVGKQRRGTRRRIPDLCVGW